jgi:hypothetical protein
MIKIVYPSQGPSTRTNEGKQQVFCVVRKKWVLLTPEEWVRQNLICYMQQVLKYPLSLMAVEKQVQVGELKKRFDIVLYKEQRPFLLLECKEMSVLIDQKTLDQALRYNIQLRAPYYIISNGNDTYGFANENGRMVEIAHFPSVL